MTNKTSAARIAQTPAELREQIEVMRHARHAIIARANGFAAKGYIQAAADFEAISDSMEEEIVRLRRLLAVATTRRRTA